MDTNDPLWKLLGESPRLETDAWFGARTWARCRREAMAPSRWSAAWPGWGWLTASVLAVALVLNIVTTRPVTLAKNSTRIQDALNFVADRGGDMDLWSE
jgi:hypothetical protein